MRRLLLILTVYLPMLLFAQAGANDYMRQGDEKLVNCRFQEALNCYYQAYNLAGNNAKLQKKIAQKAEKAQQCIQLDEQAKRAHQYGWESEEEEALRALYSICKSKKIKSLLVPFDIKRQQEKARQEEYERRMRAEREAEERRIREEEAARQRQLETDQWNYAVRQNSISEYKQFIFDFPESTHVEEAQSRINELEIDERWRNVCQTNTVAAYEAYVAEGGKYSNEALQKIDELYWAQAKNANTIESYQQYVNRSTSAPKNHIAEANQRKNDIEDANNWDRASRTNTPEAYQNYIANGGKRADEARKQIDAVYWLTALSDNSITSYRQYLDRATDGAKAHADEARTRIDQMTRQEQQITAAENAADPQVAYNHAQEARKLYKLKPEQLNRVLRVEEPYQFSQASDRHASLSLRLNYIRTYSSVAPEKHIQKIQKKVDSQERKEQRQIKAERRKLENRLRAEELRAQHKRQRRSSRTRSAGRSSVVTDRDVTSISATPSSSSRPKTSSPAPKKSSGSSSVGTTSTHSAVYGSPSKQDGSVVAYESSKPSPSHLYFENNGNVQMSWLSLDGYIGTSLGGSLSVLDWRFWYFEICPLVVGYNYIPNYSVNLGGPLMAYRQEGFYYQPYVRIYFPFGDEGQNAITFAGGPFFSFDGHGMDKPWFMTEMGYNHNTGLVNVSTFFRYNGDFNIGIQLKLCHVF